MQLLNPASALLLAGASAAAVAAAPMPTPGASTSNGTVQTQPVTFSAPVFIRATSRENAWVPHWASFGAVQDDNGAQMLTTPTQASLVGTPQEFEFVPIKSDALEYHGCYRTGGSAGYLCNGVVRSKLDRTQCIAARALPSAAASPGSTSVATHFDALPCTYAEDASLYPFVFTLQSTPNSLVHGRASNFTTVLAFAGDGKHVYAIAPGSPVRGSGAQGGGSGELDDVVQLSAADSADTGEAQAFQLVMAPSFGAYYPLQDPQIAP